MKMKLLEKLKQQKASATVEAVVSFTTFIFVIFTILSLVNLCRAQMLISSAMDNAAKELSQYSYFYKMSGLQKFDKALNEKGKTGKSQINEVIGSVDELYGSMVDSVDTTVEGYTNIAEATKNGTLDLNTFKSAYDGLSSAAGDVSANIDQMAAQFENIGDNPMLYMKSLVAIASTTGMDLLKSHAIAAPLAKFFVRQQFGKTTEEANTALEKLGVKDGFSGMNFKMSTIFSSTTDADGHPYDEDIRLVVFYKMTLLKFFDWEVWEVNMCKQSACRAWLAGDNPGEFVLVEDLTEATEATGAEEGQKPSESAPEEENSQQPTTGSTEAPTEEQKPTGVNSTGNWALEHDPTGKGYSKRVMAFRDDMENKYNLNNRENSFSYRTTDGEAAAYTYDVYTTWTYESRELLDGTIHNPGAELLKTSMKYGLDAMEEETFVNTEGKNQEFGSYTKVVYVPNNMPDYQYNQVVADAKLAASELQIYADGKEGLNVTVNIRVERAGGEYDYNSKASDYINVEDKG